MTAVKTGRGFTLLELLVVVVIITILMAILLATLSASKRAAQRTMCASNLKQIGAGTGAYLQDFHESIYWLGRDPAGNADVGDYGMDWYVYGGKTDCTISPALQNGIFHDTALRPLNRYENESIELYRCPLDTTPQNWAGGATHFDFVGNSYSFNSLGNPLGVWWPQGAHGLAGRRLSEVRRPSATVAYMDTSLHKAPGEWHGQNGNLTMLDGHGVFRALPGDDDPLCAWDP